MPNSQPSRHLSRWDWLHTGLIQNQNNTIIIDKASIPLVKNANGLPLYSFVISNDNQYTSYGLPTFVHLHGGMSQSALVIVHYTLLHLLLLNLALQVMWQVILLARAGHDPRRMRENVVHFLERHLLGLGQEGPEEDSIGEIANEENEIKPVPDVIHGNGRDLTDHGVERERDHGGN